MQGVVSWPELDFVKQLLLLRSYCCQAWLTCGVQIWAYMDWAQPQGHLRLWPAYMWGSRRGL